MAPEEMPTTLEEVEKWNIDDACPYSLQFIEWGDSFGSSRRRHRARLERLAPASVIEDTAVSRRSSDRQSLCFQMPDPCFNDIQFPNDFGKSERQTRCTMRGFDSGRKSSRGLIEDAYGRRCWPISTLTSVHIEQDRSVSYDPFSGSPRHDFRTLSLPLPLLTSKEGKTPKEILKNHT